MHQVHLTKKAKRQLVRIPNQYQKRIEGVLRKLANDPWQGKKLAGSFSDYQVMRVWPYRIIYTVRDREQLIVVITIAHRQGVYK